MRSCCFLLAGVVSAVAPTANDSGGDVMTCCSKLLAQHIHHINDAITTASTGLFQIRREGRSSLANHNQFANTGADESSATKVSAPARNRVRLVIHELRTHEQEPAPSHMRVFHGRDDRAFDFGQEHRIW